MRRIIVNNELPVLPEWDDWEGLFRDGVKLLGASLIYFAPFIVLLVIGWGAMMVPSFVVPFMEDTANVAMMLLLILGAGILSFLRGQDARPILWLFLAFGLTAVALARTHEKASDAWSVGSPPSLRRLGQLFLAVGITVGAATVVSFFYTPDRIKRTLLVGLRPLWPLLSPVLQLLLQALFLVLKPIFLGLEWLLTRLLQDLDWTFVGEIFGTIGEISDPEEVMEQTEGVFSGVPPWVWTGLRYFLIVLAILVLMGFVLLFLNKMRAKSGRDEAEETREEEITFGGATLGRGLRWLRDMVGLVRRFGLSRQLLAAISVQNIYANLCRLARGRGYPRHPAQPPDDYLSVLAQAFPSQEEALSRITSAYMRVHYGDQSVTAVELAQLRGDYNQVRKSR